MSSKKIKLNIKGKKYDIEVEQLAENTTKIKVDDKEFIFKEEKEEKGRTGVARTTLPKRNFRKKEIKAPIGGIISEVFVKENDFIKKGRKVILLSAMKMENEIISDFDGKVKKILTEKTRKVKRGEVLIILE